jgi:serine/threonine-protein kinase HipA
MAETATEVIVQIGGENVLAGRLWSHRRSAVESATFAYDADYLARPDAYALDPSLSLVAAQQQTSDGRKIFGALSDSAPDRWGRRVIARNEQRRAVREGGAERSFGEIDYLLGVRDDMRQGAVRFRDPATGAYLADEATGVPPLIDLPALLGAAGRLERDEASEDELGLLLRGGSSLGGARPKANVLDADGRAAIAKFPSANDEHEVMRWEAVALELARSAGIEVSNWVLHPIDGKAVLIVDRFDRVGDLRIGYVSAMTMLEAMDGTRASYLEIAEIIENHSPQAGEDLRELWRRIAYSVLISNTDDHLRNHGFLRTTSAGWALAPAFDLNPDPSPGTKHLSTAIDFNDDTASIDILMSVCEYFRLSEDDGRQVLSEVLGATGRWRAMAAKTGLGRTAIEQMAPAFEHDQATRATQLVQSGR